MTRTKWFHKQEEIKAIKKLIEASRSKQTNGVKKEIILVLARFVMTNNYLYLNESYNKPIRGGAMGSPLTRTIANTYIMDSTSESDQIFA